MANVGIIGATGYVGIEIVRLLQNHPDTRRHFDRVSHLIAGFETPFGMELLATVHWVASRENALKLDDVIARTYAWNERKRMFEESHIEIAWTTLQEKGWLGVV